MFDIFTDAIDSALDATSSLLEGELPSKQSVSKLFDAGLTAAEIASTLGVAESVIRGLLDD